MTVGIACMYIVCSRCKVSDKQVNLLAKFAKINPSLKLRKLSLVLKLHLCT